MNPEIKAEWVKRLRDGREQTKHMLIRSDKKGNVLGQCCLGVLCEMAEDAGAVISLLDRNDITYYGAEKVHGVLPIEVVKWAQIHNAIRNPLVRFTNKSNAVLDRTLSQLNDDGYTFNEIADIIEGSNEL